MILAAGRGERMRPLTDSIPKPLLEVRGKPLIVWQIESLVRSGIREIVINLAHLGDQIEKKLGDGRCCGVSILYSWEEKALETAGGIANAIHLLGKSPFLAVNSDIYCDFDYSRLNRSPLESMLAHLVLVDNPGHHPEGDFSLCKGKVLPAWGKTLTFSGIGVYRPELFTGIHPGQAAKLGDLLKDAIQGGKVTGIRHGGIWVDVGTPERLFQLNSGDKIGS